MQIGRYEIGRLLGEGGAGRVYEAVLRGPGGFRRRVALKVLRDGHADADREARLGGLLRHANLVDVYEIGEAEGTWFCALELCEGGSLAGRAPLPPRAVVDVGLQVCAALRYAHEELGLVHRDIKPANLLLTSTGTVKVGDLGIARADGFQGDARVRGTPGYMPPEQASGGAVDARADVHALGVTLVELATGQRPSAAGTLAWSSLDDDAPAADVAPDVPDWLAPAVERCLAPDPEDRWPSMDALASALRGLHADGPTLADSVGRGAGGGRLAEDVAWGEGNVFVGRRAEVDRLSVAFAAGGVVVLRGPAGVGKSRLAAEAARAWSVGHGAPAWCCDLSDARSLDGVASAVARTLDVPLGRGDAVEQLGRALAARGPAVLVLDSFEHVSSLAAVVERWRDAAPQARLVVTSRVALDLAGAVVDVPVLPADDAVTLLVERARERGVEIAGDPDALALAARLDGLPLALELAAGRLGVLTLRDVLERLSLSLLRRGTEHRHGTLRAALDWSWGLMTDEDRHALARLSVFAGGFTLEAAEEVIRPDRSILDVVESLARQSMVHPQAHGRFGLLTSVHEYAAEKLADLPGADGVELRHGELFARLAREGRPEDPAFLARLGDDFENLAVACRRAVAREDGDRAVRCLAGCALLCDAGGPISVLHDLAERVLGSPLAAEQRLPALMVSARLRALAGHPQALDRALEALACARALEQTREEIEALRRVGFVHLQSGEYALAREAHRGALDRARAYGDVEVEAVVLQNYASAAFYMNAREEAGRCWEHALAIHRAAGRRSDTALVLTNLGVMAMESGDLALAEQRYREALAIHRELRDRRLESNVLGNLAHALREGGRFEEARRCLEDALEIARRIGLGPPLVNLLAGYATLLQDLELWDEAEAAYADAIDKARAVRSTLDIAIGLGNLGSLLAMLRRDEEAEAKLREAIGIVREIGYELPDAAFRAQLGEVLAHRGDTAGALLEIEAGVAVLRRLQSAVELGKALARLAVVRAMIGDVTATDAYREAVELAAAANVAPASELGRQLTDTAAALGLPRPFPAAV